MEQKIKIKKSDILKLAQKIKDKKNNKDLGVSEVVDRDGNYIQGDEPLIPDNSYSTSSQTTDDNVKTSQQGIDYTRTYGYSLWESSIYESLLSNEDYDIYDIKQDPELVKISEILKKKDKRVLLSFMLSLMDNLNISNAIKIKEKILNKLKTEKNLVK